MCTHISNLCPSTYHLPHAGSSCCTLVITSMIIFLRGLSVTSLSQPVVTAIALHLIKAVLLVFCIVRIHFYVSEFQVLLVFHSHASRKACYAPPDLKAEHSSNCFPTILTKVSNALSYVNCGCHIHVNIYCQCKK